VFALRSGDAVSAPAQPATQGAYAKLRAGGVDMGHGDATALRHASAYDRLGLRKYENDNVERERPSACRQRAWTIRLAAPVARPGIVDRVAGGVRNVLERVGPTASDETLAKI